ncbi:TonB-dependent receptor [Porphyromonas pogonae]|uniref:TonB-dependent receptor n=1 Tax=Porphyromonas pogonae TaxID=867595 RepID=UPI002E776D83|nr:TonB-dependent receptor [Porphyromonas pogonae]
MYNKKLYIVLIGICMSVQTGWAQKKAKTETPIDSLYNHQLGQVVVSAKKVTQKPDYALINAGELKLIRSNTLGATLSRIPGIQNTSYGPNAGTPMIRSLGSNRVKVLYNGLGMSDLSGISPTLNINANQDNIESLEVYKNSAAVLFGGRAIGGAVNIHTSALPDKLDDKRLNAMINLEGSTNSGFKQAVNLRWNDGKHWAISFGAMNSNNHKVRIPGNSKYSLCYDKKEVGFDPILQSLCQVNVKSEHVLNKTIFPYLNQFALDHLNDPDYDLSENDKYTFKPTYYDPKKFKQMPNPKNDLYVPGQDIKKDMYKDEVREINDYGPVKKGEITNSHSNAKAINMGVSYLGDNFRLGAAYQGNFAYYGVPVYARWATFSSVPHGNHSHAVANFSPYMPVNVRNRSHNVMLDGEWRPSMPFIKAVKMDVSGQYSRDTELLSDIGVNQFKTYQQAGRLAFDQIGTDFYTGSFGFDYNFRKMNGAGRLRYLPNNKSNEVGAYITQNLKYKMLDFKVGYRHERANRSAYKDDTYKRSRGLSGGTLSDRHYNLNQFNSSLEINLLKMITLSASFNHSERAPEVNELYAGNDHFAIAIEENGDDRLNKEMSNSFELGAAFSYENLFFSVNYYKTHFNNYLYLGHTGVDHGSFPVKEWRAANTDIDGLEMKLAYKLSTRHLGEWNFSSYYDIVKNKNTSADTVRRHFDGDYMPNMPTSRVGFGLNFTSKKFTADVTLDHYMKQTRLGKNLGEEHPMPAYSLLGARVAYLSHIASLKSEYYIYGTNLLNQEARPQNSILKYLAPLPGINIGLGVRLSL